MQGDVGVPKQGGRKKLRVYFKYLHCWVTRWVPGGRGGVALNNECRYYWQCSYSPLPLPFPDPLHCYSTERTRRSAGALLIKCGYFTPPPPSPRVQGYWKSQGNLSDDIGTMVIFCCRRAICLSSVHRLLEAHSYRPRLWLFPSHTTPLKHSVPSGYATVSKD